MIMFFIPNTITAEILEKILSYGRIPESNLKIKFKIKL